MSDELQLLDSAKSSESLSVAKARHLVRTHMLAEVLEALHMIGMNPETKDSDRNTALIFLAKFAEGEGGDDYKFAAKLSPSEAQMIARVGIAQNRKRLEAGNSEGSTGAIPYKTPGQVPPEPPRAVRTKPPGNSGKNEG